jgi:hypothetical protein
MGLPYPFAALVAQEDMKQALLLAVVDPSLGGVMVFGDRGTGKSTAVRGASEPGRPCPWSTCLWVPRKTAWSEPSIWSVP